MEKSELSSLVSFAYALWNKELFEVDKKNVYQAWWAVLKDLPEEEVRNEITQLSLVEKFLPSPGAIRRAYKNSRMENPPPTPQQFWAFIQGVIQSRNSGTHQIVGDLHPVAAAAIEELGAVAFSLTTNGDREYALDCYERCLKQWLRNQLTVVEDA